MMSTAIGIDLGGTRIKGVVINTNGDLLDQHYIQIEQDNWKQCILETADLLSSRYPDNTLIGMSAPGIPAADNSCIAYMPGRLQGLEGLHWGTEFKRDTWVANDAIAALAAEAKFGIAKDVQHAVMITIGTGVGGALLINGKIYQAAFQKAGHAGHISVDHEGEQDITGMPGSLEDAIGNCTIQKRSNGKYDDTRFLIEDVIKGDQFANQVWQTSVKKLSVAIASITNLLSPEMIILGGGITEAGGLLFEPLEKFMSKYEWRAGGRKVNIVKAAFGDLSGAIGAAGFAMMQQDQSKQKI